MNLKFVIILILYLTLCNNGYCQSFADPCYGESSIIISPTGTLYGWGASIYGLWDGGTGDYIDTPQTLLPPNDSSVWSQISANKNVAFLLTSRNELYVCANSLEYVSKVMQAQKPLSRPTYYKSDLGISQWDQVKLAGQCVIAIAKSGEAYGWTQLPSKKLGVNFFPPDLPYHIPFPATVTRWNDAETTDDNHFFLLGDDKNLYGFGINDSGQLGIVDTKESLIPRKVTLPDGEIGWKAVATTMQYSVGIALSGRIYEWGYLDMGNLSRKSLTPKLIPFNFEGELPIAIKASIINNISILTDQGNIYTWGSNTQGECGLGDHSIPHQYPTRIPAPQKGSKWTAIGASYYSMYGVDDKCNLYAWGGNHYAEVLPNPIINSTVDMPTFVLNVCGNSDVSAFGQKAANNTIFLTSNILSIPISETETIKRVLVYNSIGSCIQMPFSLYLDKIVIDFSGLSNGFYTIITNTGGIKLLLLR